MKKYFLGSSETTREASISNSKNAFSLYQPFCPQHRVFDPVFLEWFVGFLEGDGNFQMWEDNGRLRFAVQITQNDQQLLQNLRTQLGFGRVCEISGKDGKKYPQLRFEKRQNILALLHLCIGNLRLTKTQTRFQSWALQVCQRFHISMPSNPHGLSHQPISLESPWLSGFFQADGGFNSQYRQDNKLSKGYCVALRAYIDQKGEETLLGEISQLLGGSVYCRNKQKSYYRLNIATGFQPLVDYLTRFPLRGRKKIAQSRWIRLVNYLQTYQLPEPGTKSHKRFLRLVENVNTCQRVGK